MQDETQNDQQDQNINPSAQPPAQQQPSVPENLISKEEMEGIVKHRLRNERQKAEEAQKQADSLKRQLEELKRKFESGKATTNESADYVTTSNIVDQAHNKGIDPAEIPGIIQDHLKMQKLEQNIKEASTKDSELSKLINDPNSLSKISPQELETFKEYDNPAALLKHLLTDDNDRLVYKATQIANANGDGGVKYWEFLGNLSKKLKSAAVYPHPSNYKPSADLSDVGEAEEFNTESYIKEKYG